MAGRGYGSTFFLSHFGIQKQEFQYCSLVTQGWELRIPITQALWEQKRGEGRQEPLWGIGVNSSGHRSDI